MHHFEKVSGQARILVQIAAHVSGAAYYYQRQDVIDQPWPADEVESNHTFVKYCWLPCIRVTKDLLLFI